MELLTMKGCVGRSWDTQWTLSLLQYFTIHSSVTSFWTRDNITSLLATACHTCKLQNLCHSVPITFASWLDDLQQMQVSHWSPGSGHAASCQHNDPLSPDEFNAKFPRMMGVRGWQPRSVMRNEDIWHRAWSGIIFQQGGFHHRFIKLRYFTGRIEPPGSSVPEREDFNSKIMGKQAAEEC